VLEAGTWKPEAGSWKLEADVPSRRAFIKSAAISVAALAFMPGCAPRRFVLDSRHPRRRFARVLVSPDRVIRTIAGLRPFRPSGFVLRAERAGERLLIHDYGHGGAGVTLSWGTSQLAVDELQGWTGARDRCAVIGCGAVGLATARLLQQRGLSVTVYAKDIPPDTTSNVAGAQWGPFSVFDAGRTTPTFDDQFTRAARISWRRFQDLPPAVYGIRWLENYTLSNSPFRDPPRRDLYVDPEELGPRDHPFPARYARRFTTMLIETSTYMAAMLRDFYIAGGKLVVRDFSSRDQLLALDEPIVFNCTGLGSRALFGDDELTPVKGQLTILLPQNEVDYITLAGGRYMFPRSDGILLGGTFERGVWTVDPDRDTERRILDDHRRFFEAMRASGR
jgi:glycine/D-amino acid oxidase-like deaminating enzyme